MNTETKIYASMLIAIHNLHYPMIEISQLSIDWQEDQQSIAIYLLKYFSAIDKTSSRLWMNFKDIAWNKRIQPQSTTYFIIPFAWCVMNGQTHRDKVRLEFARVWRTQNLRLSVESSRVSFRWYYRCLKINCGSRYNIY